MRAVVPRVAATGVRSCRSQGTTSTVSDSAARLGGAADLEIALLLLPLDIAAVRKYRVTRIFAISYDKRVCRPCRASPSRTSLGSASAIRTSAATFAPSLFAETTMASKT